MSIGSFLSVVWYLIISVSVAVQDNTEIRSHGFLRHGRYALSHHEVGVDIFTYNHVHSAALCGVFCARHLVDDIGGFLIDSSGEGCVCVNGVILQDDLIVDGDTELYITPMLARIMNGKAIETFSKCIKNI